MSKFEQFKRKLKERMTEGSHIKDDYILQICGNVVDYVYISFDKNGEEYIFCSYNTHRISDTVYQYEVDENLEYQIEWFVLEKDDEQV